MSISSILDVSASAMSAQTMRLSVVASNIANANSLTSSNGKPYRAREVVFRTAPVARGGEGVSVAGVVQSKAPLRRVYQPGNPLADANGYVKYPNVHVVDEMINMISASRSYKADADVANAAKALYLKTLTL